MKVIIAGSREEKSPAFVQEGIEAALASWGLWTGASQDLEVVTGGARGVDTLAHEWAVREGYATRVFPAHWKVYGRAAGILRNQEMAVYVGADGSLIALHRDIHNSKGTKSMVTIAQHLGLRVYVYEGPK